MSDSKHIAMSASLGFPDRGVGESAIFHGAHGFQLPLNFRILARFGDQVSGVLVHVAGSLYLVIGHYASAKSTSVYLLDRTRMDGVMPENFIASSMELREVIKAYGRAVVKSFYWDNDQWRTLKLPAGF